MKAKDIWDKIHNSYSSQDWINKPSIFAESVVPLFPRVGKILEIGGGLGQDSKYFSELGYTVLLTDISEDALIKAKESFKPDSSIETKVLDISKPLPFDNDSFDVVYSHLSIHYFNTETTKSIFKEVRRVLRTGGIFAILLNSTTDPEYNTGDKIEENYFNIDSLPKRFFDEKSILEFAKDFEAVLVDNKGESYKDQKKGIHNLIRYIGRRSY